MSEENQRPPLRDAHDRVERVAKRRVRARAEELKRPLRDVVRRRRLVKAWLLLWEEWECEPPEWFTLWWRKRAGRFSRGFLPDVARERLERERAEFRRSRREQQQPQQNSNASATTTDTRPVASTTGVSPQAKHSKTAVHPFP